MYHSLVVLTMDFVSYEGLSIVSQDTINRSASWNPPLLPDIRNLVFKSQSRPIFVTNLHLKEQFSIGLQYLDLNVEESVIAVYGWIFKHWSVQSWVFIGSEPSAEVALLFVTTSNVFF